MKIYILLRYNGLSYSNLYVSTNINDFVLYCLKCYGGSNIGEIEVWENGEKIKHIYICENDTYDSLRRKFLC